MTKLLFSLLIFKNSTCLVPWYFFSNKFFFEKIKKQGSLKCNTFSINLLENNISFLISHLYGFIIYIPNFPLVIISSELDI